MHEQPGYVSKFTGQVLVPVVTPAKVTDHDLECKHCSKPFYSSRSHAKFCSPNCRKASSRRASRIRRDASRIRNWIDLLRRIAGDDEKLQIVLALELDAIRAKCDHRRDDTSAQNR